jgi:hypothetical protein
MLLLNIPEAPDWPVCHDRTLSAPAPPPDDTKGAATDADITTTKQAIKNYIAARLAYDKLVKDE